MDDGVEWRLTGLLAALIDQMHAEGALSALVDEDGVQWRVGVEGREVVARDVRVDGRSVPVRAKDLIAEQFSAEDLFLIALRSPTVPHFVDVPEQPGVALGYRCAITLIGQGRPQVLLQRPLASTL